MSDRLIHLLTPARSRRASVTGVAALLFVGVTFAAGPAAEAAGTGSTGLYELHVVSSGMAFHINDPNLVLQPDVGFGPYAASAALDNLGANATAGAPNLGDYVGPLVGHFNGLGSGQIPRFPPVPGEVSSSYPGDPSAAQRNSGYAIAAASSEHQATATVNLGATSPGATNGTLFSLAQAAVDGSGVLNAVGSAGVDLFNIGGVLDIGRVSSNISMTDAGSGVPKFVTATDVGTITVSGQKFGLDRDGLTAAGTNSGSSADQVNSATEALKQAGISIRYLPATVTYAPGTHTVQSMESGAVQVSDQYDVPSQGLTTTTYTLGYVGLIAKANSSGAVQTARVDHASSTASGARSSRATALATRKFAADGGGSDVAIITPTLRILHFGAAIGTPDTCNIIFGILGTGATQAGLGAGSAPAFANVVDQCLTMSSSWGDQINGAMPQVEPLAVINPAIDPGIDAFADALESVGRDHADSVAPFGPTIEGMADSARFFKGCDKC
jgi:hypothetical protein